MKNVVRWSLTVLLAGGMLAGAQTAPKKATHKAAKKPAAPAITQEDVQALKDALAAQQQQIESLKQEMQHRDQTWQQTQTQLQQAQQEAADAKAKAAALEATTSQQAESYTKLNNDLNDVKTGLTNASLTAQDDQKRMGAIEALAGRFRFTGDVRVRGESFFQNYSGCTNTACQDRNRSRVRVRFGAEGKIGESFLGGFTLATGLPGDPISTNQTLTNFFDRKTIGLDRAYITYAPKYFKPLQLTGGKFAYTWMRTPQTFDSDLNPEGFSGKLSFDTKTPFVKNVTIVGYTMLMNEVSRGGDAFATGGQISARIQPFGDRWTLTAAYGATKFDRPDQILSANAFAVGSATGSGQVIIPPSTTPTIITVPTPGEGPGCASIAGLPATGSTGPIQGVNGNGCVFGPQGMTNSTFIDANGRPHFLSGFLYSDLILNNQIKTPWKRLPFNLNLEYLDNLDAADHPNTTGNVIDTTLGKQSHMYLIDASVGQNRNKGDIQVGYAFVRQEQDSAIASFIESDQRAPTNIVQHKIYGTWRVAPNVTAAYTLWVGRTLNRNLQNRALIGGFNPTDPNTPEPWLKRMQFDLIYTF